MFPSRNSHGSVRLMGVDGGKDDLFIPQIPEAAMAETSQTTTNPNRAAQRAGGPQAEGVSVDGEPRSFQQGSAGETAKAAAEAGRHLAETGRQAGRDAAHIARSALEPWGMLQGDFNRWFDDMWRQARREDAR